MELEAVILIQGISQVQVVQKPYVIECCFDAVNSIFRRIIITDLISNQIKDDKFR